RTIAAQDYRFFYGPARRRMSHGYYVHLASQSRYHYGTLYAESRLGSLIAIGKGDVPEEHWFAMARTFAPSCRWQTQTPHGRVRKEVRGQAFFGGWYEWKGAKYVPSWGGSMFEALMAALALGVAPEAAGDLRELARRYDLYGDFGFYDAVDPRSGDVAHAYLALDQTMTFIAAANYLKDHCIQRRFASDPIAEKALPILADERFFD